MKTQFIHAVCRPFTRDGISLAASLTDLAQNYARYIEGNVDRLQVEHWADPTEEFYAEW